MMKPFKTKPFESKRAAGAAPSLEYSEYVTFQAGPEQVERLGALGVLSGAEWEAGRQAGGLLVRLPQNLVAQFVQSRPTLAQSSPVEVIAPLPPNLDSAISPSMAPEERPAPVAKTPTGMENEAQEIERLAGWLDEAGLNGLARFLIGSNRPMSFFASQFLLLVQPVSSLALGPKDPAGRFSALLEKRANVDRLLVRLEELTLTRPVAPDRKPAHSPKSQENKKARGKLQ